MPSAPTSPFVRPAPDGGDLRGVIRVQDCLDLLGEELRLLRADAAALRGKVTDVHLHDPADAHLVGPGSIVLAVGAAPGEPTSQLLAMAAARGASAVVLRAGTTAIEAPGVAVLGLRDGVSWAQGHERLLGALRESGPRPQDDLHAVANTIAAATGGATVVEDVRRRVLAFSNLEEQPIDGVRRHGILDRQMPIVPEAEYEYRAIAERPEAQRFPPIPAVERGGRLGIAVRAGGLLLGSIWVVDADGTLPESALRALTEAAELAAMSLLRDAERVDPEERTRSDAARHLLTGELQRVEHDAWLRGFHLAVVVAVAIERRGRADTAAYLRRAASTLATYLGAYREHAATTVLRGRVYAIVGLSAADEDVLPLVRDAAAHLERVLRVAPRLAVGGVSGDTAELVHSLAEADEVLALGGPAGTVTTMGDVRASVLLARLRGPAGAAGLLDEARLRRLLDHDAEHGTGYAETLRTYLEAFGDVGRAAERQQVHPNTVRYRLRKIRELLDCSLDAPDDRLLLHLQLRMLGT